jgi:alanyl-tRNA synthetase
VLGKHVQQKGSLVNEKILRFDFSHFSKMTQEEILEVERIVNGKIRENIVLNEQRNIPIENAKEMGATALFGEKYGEFVRVITYDKDYSVELCGGTHVDATGQIGMLKITSEGSVAAGVRRIEAITADKAEDYYQKQDALLTQVNEWLNNPKNTLKAIENLINEKQTLTKALETANQEKANAQNSILQNAIVASNGYNVLISEAKFPDADGLKKISFELKNEITNLIMIIAADIAGKPQISIMISDELVKSLDLNAGKLIKELAREIKGGGGGQPFYATAGGKDISGLSNAVAKANEIISDIIN